MNAGCLTIRTPTAQEGPTGLRAYGPTGLRAYGERRVSRMDEGPYGEKRIKNKI